MWWLDDLIWQMEFAQRVQNVLCAIGGFITGYWLVPWLIKEVHIHWR